jgi:hypothetical protein
MKNRSHIGNRPGNPSYRTSSQFRARKSLQVQVFRSKKFSLSEKLMKANIKWGKNNE